MILMKSNNLLNYRLNRHTDINIVKEGGWLDYIRAYIHSINVMTVTIVCR